jgi:release factor glutamine methyltransferase
MTPGGDDHPDRRTPERPPAAPAPAPAPAEGGPGPETWTVGRLLTWTTDYLKRKGAQSPRLDAEVLLAFALKSERVWLYTHYEEPVGEGSRAAFRELVRRRSEGTPVAYLVGRKEFFSLALEVGPAVLIPRPDTETVVVEFLTTFKGQAEVSAVDVGTGSGAIALACLSQHRTARFLATDASAGALALALRNAEKHALADRVRFAEGDLLEPAAAEGPFDAILSNPPYIPSGDIAGLEPGVRDYEPHLALDGGPDGLDVVRRLSAQAVPLLRPGGHLILEIGTAQERAVREIVGQLAGLEVAPTVRDAANHPRVVRARRI